MAKATFAAGCFWGVEHAFRQIDGVTATAVGYTGGTYPNPSYRDVCSGQTGHTEAVQVEYDPTQVGYEALLEAFWTLHDPTQVDRQGPDIGTQYRSAVFCHDAEQQEAATASKERLDRSGRLRRSVATEIQPAADFYLAEDYHQQYFEKKGFVSCALPGH